MDLTPVQVASQSAAYWSILKCLRLQASKFSFTDREYQKELLSTNPRRRCSMKATQGGFTELEVIDSLHGMIYGHLPQGVLYLFPTTDDVQEFSKARFNPLLANNKQAIGNYVKSAGKGTDTASLKKIRDSFLYLRGARLSQKISDVNESSKLKSIPVDRVVFDEVDHMDESVQGKARNRMGNSLVKQERYLSNPLIPGEGVDKIFQLSDQRYWFRKCLSCGKHTCAELFFMEDPERCVGIRADGTGYIACHNCGREVHIRDGEWVAQIPSNSDYMWGYQWSQLTSITNDPLEILRDYRNPPEGNFADVMRLRLGLPYIAAEDRLTRGQIYECCSQDKPEFHSKESCIAGVDVGKVKHIVVGYKTGKKQYKLIKTTQLTSWDDIHDTFRRFNVKNAVVDIRPYEDSAREFQKNAKKYGCKVYLCEYKENQPQEAIYNDATGIVGVNRTEIFDATHALATEEGRLTIPRKCDETAEFAKQMCGAYKVLEKNKKTGTSVYRYKGKNEHFRNALNYFLLAGRKTGISQKRRKQNRQTHANNSYKVI